MKVPDSTRCLEPEYSVPALSSIYGGARWIPAGEPVTVQGIKIPGGLIYVGAALQTITGEVDPCLIDPSKSIDISAGPARHGHSDWSSYSVLSPVSRLRYLEWLAGGRSDTNADVGCLLLFLFGLERRVVLDAPAMSFLCRDLDPIFHELRRLQSVYRGRSDAFDRQAAHLLNWLLVARYDSRLYQKPPPSIPEGNEFPLHLRLGLGQVAEDGIHVPADWAHEWTKRSPELTLGPASTQCDELFRRLFLQRYANRFNGGLKLPRASKRLEFKYCAASPALRGKAKLAMHFGTMPDVAALAEPLEQLRSFASSIEDELSPYAALVRERPEAAGALEGLVLLPLELWPPATRSAVDSLLVRVAEGPFVLALHELQSVLQQPADGSKSKVLSLARGLESLGVCMEPDVLRDDRIPKPADSLALFAALPAECQTLDSSSYQVDLLSLQLAREVMAGDGTLSVDAMDRLRSEVRSWTHVAPGLRRRLDARLEQCRSAPTPTRLLRPRLAALDITAREGIATFLSALIAKAGTPSPQQLDALRKCYTRLGLDSCQAIGDLHAALVAPKSGPAARRAVATGPHGLDSARIALIQAETAKVALVLDGVFAQEDDVATPAAASSRARAQTPDLGSNAAGASVGNAAGALLGLDAAHLAFARCLSSRPSWTRAEVSRLAATHGLMPDGALEALNEAALDAMDLPFTEGDDPIEVNSEALEL